MAAPKLNTVSYSSFSNEKLLEEYQAGDYEAFEEFFKRNQKIIFYFLLKKVSKNETAEDMLQNTFVRIHKYILKYDPNQNAINWVLTIAQNCCYDHHSKHKEHEEITEDAAVSLDPNQKRIECSQEIQELFKNLKQSEKDLILARLLEEKSFEEIAKEQKMTSTNARQKISRLLKKDKISTCLIPRNYIILYF